MLQRIYSLLGGQHQPLGYTVVSPIGNNSSTNGQQQQQQRQQQHVVRVPSPHDTEDFELRLSFDLAECTMQPLNVVGLRESDSITMLVYLMPERLASNGSDDQPLLKVYEAPAHNPQEPLAYRVGREYLLCLKHPSSSKPVALLSVMPQEQNIVTIELALLPYWSMKWFERDFRRGNVDSEDSQD